MSKKMLIMLETLNPKVVACLVKNQVANDICHLPDYAAVSTIMHAVA